MVTRLSVSLWDAATGELTGRLLRRDHPSFIAPVLASGRDGAVWAIASEQRMWLWDPGVRRYRDDVILCAVNLSRTVQPAELDLSAFAGLVPVEMLGYTEFPSLGDAPYFLSLGPYGFYWFELQHSRS